MPDEIPRASVPPPTSREELHYRSEESRVCETMAEAEGDRLLKQGDRLGAEVAHRIAAMIRIRRNDKLEPFAFLVLFSNLVAWISVASSAGSFFL